MKILNSIFWVGIIYLVVSATVFQLRNPCLTETQRFMLIHKAIQADTTEYCKVER